MSLADDKIKAIQLAVTMYLLVSLAWEDGSFSALLFWVILTIVLNSMDDKEGGDKDEAKIH